MKSFEWAARKISLKMSRRDFLEKLSKLQLRFYMYNLPRLKLEGCKDKNVSFSDPENLDFLGTDAQVERLILCTLQRHPLRTLEPSEADLFVIPISPASLRLKYINSTEDQERFYTQAFGALTRHEIFRSTYGSRHIIVSLWYAHFEHRFRRIHPYNDDAIFNFYDRLWNVTVADCKSRTGIEKLYQVGKYSDFMQFFDYERIRTTRSSFSVGMIPSENIPLLTPTLEKFNGARYFLFYHTRPSKFWSPKSDSFRKAALNKTIVQGLPTSSIGYDVSSSTWRRRMASSKFCLVVRGDDPGSHGLYRSVKAGCIPVVISDAYPEYSPAIPSLLNITDYSIFLPESSFIENPLRELLKLADLPESLIAEKLNALARVQQVVLPDHPRSLFVPAFLWEATKAIDEQLPYETHQEYKKWLGCANATSIFHKKNHRYCIEKRSRGFRNKA